MKKIILMIGIVVILLVSGCDDVRVCRYDDDCVVTTGMMETPCCHEVGLSKPFEFNYNWTNMCCYPLNCPDSKNNPEL